MLSMRTLAEGLKLVALFGAVALVVWTMPSGQSLDSDRRDPMATETESSRTD